MNQATTQCPDCGSTDVTIAQTFQPGATMPVDPTHEMRFSVPAWKVWCPRCRVFYLVVDTQELEAKP